MTTPWSMAKRAAVKRKIDKEAARAAARIGASHVLIVACFPEGKEHVHILDGGTAPMEYGKMYEHMASVTTMVQSGYEGPVQ